MKKAITVLALGILWSLLPGWNGAIAQEPLEFTGSFFNPVLTHGDPGSYDGDLLVAPYALWDNGAFYIFYAGNGGGCLATSSDGLIYTKFAGNPVITPSGNGFDSLFAGGGPVLKVGPKWVMYYGARQYPGWGPGESTGRATADSLTGVWERSSAPVLTIGSPGEWDAGLVNTNNVLPLDTGGFIMFYYASDDFNSNWLMGMATSPDGITWTKYNDPATTQAPFAESDPILPAGAPGEFDEWGVTGAGVLRMGGYYHMYYAALCPDPTLGYRSDIGYAYSSDGISWEKWPENPVYVQENDPYFNNTTMIYEQPCTLVNGSTVYLYYDYGTWENSLGLATAPNIWVGINERITNYKLQITNYPNPVYQSTTFFYSLKDPGQVKLEIFDSFGRLVEVLENASRPKGKHQVTWNAENYPAGIYNYRLWAGGAVGKGKVIKF
ncbi:MAG: T9SS type A sorting domain-containing protein [Bacteroidales bacterium]|nr:T9SS type A sorting domain-containing protein [Bacteroidales bacterium]